MEAVAESRSEAVLLVPQGPPEGCERPGSACVSWGGD